MTKVEDKIRSTVREIPDFPKKGISFKDITPLLEDPKLSSEITDEFVEKIKNFNLDAIVGIESRGFIYGFHLAQKLGLPFVLARKKGKLPHKTVSFAYDLEYGKAEIEMHIDAIKPGDNVLIHDDLLATGGTANAVAEIVKQLKGNIQCFAFLIELGFLKGDEALKQHSNNIVSLVKY